jgi:hypothetical protein
MPDAPREWTLEGRKKRTKTAPPVRQCPECYACHSPAPACPVCGHVYAAEVSGRAIPQSGEGELIEVTNLSVPKLADVLKTAKTFEDVESIRVERGYKPGWTRAIMAHRRNKVEYTTAAEDFA